MSIQVVTATTPAAGQDWSFVVPGQWYPYLYGVTAVLTTATPVTQFPDETANNNPATLVGVHNNPLGAPGPYAAGLNNYAVNGDGATTANNNIANTSTLALYAATPGTIEQLVFLPSFVTGKTDGIGLCMLNSGANAVEVGIGTDATSHADPAAMRLAGGGSILAITGTPTMSRNAWHSVAVTWDGVQYLIYLDGVNVGSHAGNQPVFGGAARMCAAGQPINNPPYGRCAAAAVYGAALSAAQLAAHFNALSSWSAYRAAVLADAPLGLWGLNTVPQGPSRIVTLKLTDGTNTLAQFPANFAAATAQSFTWSWQVVGPGQAQAVGGTINSVPIPELSLQPGYVISASTLDLQATDRWSAVTLWFDDGVPLGPPAPGGGGFDFLDVTIV